MADARLDGKVCVVTGACGALGKAASAELAKLGATVVMVCRDLARGDAAAEDVRKAAGSDRVELMTADLSSLDDLRRLAQGLAARHPAVHVLLNNAAVYSKERKVTKDGLELRFATNHLAPFLPTNLLRPALEEGAPARVITISAPSTSQPDFDDLQGEKNWGTLHAFGVSKMGNLLFTFGLARRLDKAKVTAVVVHPGLMKSNLMREAPALIRILIGPLSKRPEVAAAKAAALASSPEFAGLAGAFLKGTKVSKAAAYATAEANQDRMWEASVRLTGTSR